jgi:hypothetical protein
MELFTDYERLETCHRVEVTVENLHLLAQHFGGVAIYAADEQAPHWQSKKPRLSIPRARGEDSVIEVGAWVDERGIRWNPEPLTQGWHPAGTYQEAGDG